MRGKYGAGQDSYCYPGSDTLRNRLGITDPDLLEQAEREISALEAQSIEFREPPYDLAYLQALHRKLFGELYAWAGKIRTIDISKQQTRFCTAPPPRRSGSGKDFLRTGPAELLGGTAPP